MLDFWDIVTRIMIAALMGAAIGLNRNLHHKYVGLRTLALIGASISAIVLATQSGRDSALHLEATSRVVQGILTGLGFIGAGVIVRGPNETKVHGLTTAASVWTTAILAVLAGSGAWRVALVLSVVTALVLLLGGTVERRLRRLLHGEHHDAGETASRTSRPG